MVNYFGAIAQLLTIGECRGHDSSQWLDYTALGITADDIPVLIQMATDDELYDADSEAPESWAPIHAWRALGQLKAAAAVELLLQYSGRFTIEDGWLEWMLKDLPSALALIGEASLPALAKFLSDRSQSDGTRLVASSGLEKCAQAVDSEGTVNSSLRQQSIAILAAELTHAAENDAAFNGCLVAALANLDAVAAASVIEQAFAGDYVDETIVGDWPEVQVHLGLKTREEVPRRSFFSPEIFTEDRLVRPEPDGFVIGSNYGKDKRKAKRQQQSASRRKNRKKKK